MTDFYINNQISNFKMTSPTLDLNILNLNQPIFLDDSIIEKKALNLTRPKVLRYDV